MKHLYSLLYLLIWIPVLSFGQSFKGKVYDVTQYGAVSDTTILSTEAFQKAIDTCAAQG